MQELYTLKNGRFLQAHPVALCVLSTILFYQATIVN